MASGREEQADMAWPGKVLSRDEPEVKALYDEQATMGGEMFDAAKIEPILKEEPRGPLRPDHLREAWRRYRASMQSHGAGTLNLWHAQQHSGVERFPIRTGSRRIFK